MRKEKESQHQEPLLKVLLVGVNVNNDPDFETSFAELAGLAQACGMEVVGTETQKVSQVNTGVYVGTGKVDEIKAVAHMLEAEAVVFDNSLSPMQLRNLTEIIERPVYDRTLLILRIFSSRARSREAQIQVETARLEYELPRLTGLGLVLSRQGGGSGSLSNRGAGEKKLELDKRKIRRRISELKKELKEVEKNRQTQRKRRLSTGIPQVALVGYTNAGKSTLMNALIDYSESGGMSFAGSALKTESGAESEVDSRIDLRTDAGTDLRIDPRTDAGTDLRIDPGTDARIGAKTDSQGWGKEPDFQADPTGLNGKGGRPDRGSLSKTETRARRTGLDESAARPEDSRKVLVEDMLFATLDTTIRRIRLPDHKEFLLSDTVGFINRLPHNLIESFQSTLEEVRQADLLLEVVDLSDRNYEDHMRVTAETLDKLGAGDIPCIHVFNKCDLAEEETPFPRVSGDSIYIAAGRGIGLAELTDMIRRSIFPDYLDCSMLIPYGEGALVSYFNEHASIKNVEYLAEGTLITMNCLLRDLKKYKEYLV